MAFRAFPGSNQTQFFVQSGPLYQGLAYRHGPNDHSLSGNIRAPAEVAQEDTVTVTYGADGDGIGYTFDGLTIPALALTDDDTSAAALETAINAYIAANPGGKLASVSRLANVLTPVFADFVPHDTGGFATGASTVVVTPGVAALSYARLQYGLGVTVDPNSTGFDIVGTDSLPIAGPEDDTSKLLGILCLSHGGEHSLFQADVLGYDSDYLIPNLAYKVVKRGGVLVPWVGTLPSGPAGQVYWINDPSVEADRGKFRSDDAGGEAVLVSGARVEGLDSDQNLVAVFFDPA